MAKKRPEMTSVDYVVIGLSPFLIMVLVGSLCFFLLEVGYRGQFSGRLHWILFWFVVGAVGIARISMEEGAERASLYGLGLAGAVAVAVLRFVDSPWIAWALMAVAWWCAHKLTWDCTLIDDDQDASGEGLLQVAGLEESLGADAGPESNGADADEKPKRSSWLDRLLESPEQRRKRPHAPGVWVVYFSLAALPLFGLGQAFIPAADVERRRQAFWLLVMYVGSGLGLLLTTSFLGLRRYLRQRKLEMPLVMTGAWLGVGAVLIVALVLVAMLVPRPSPEYPVENMIANAIRSPLRSASRHALLRDSGVEQGPPGAAAGGAQGEDTRGQEDKETRGQGDKGNEEQNGTQSNSDPNPQPPTPNSQPPTPNSQPPTPNSQFAKPRMPDLSQVPLAAWIRWVLWVGLALAALVGFLKYRSQVTGFVRQLWAELLSLLNDLFGGRKIRAGDATEEERSEPPRPFAAFRNPFDAGNAERISPDQLVRYTFEALEAWTFERAAARRQAETPLEFAAALNQRFPALANDARQLALIYSQMVYARTPPTRESLPVLRRLWAEMSRREVVALRTQTGE
ncbi:MAG TPA: DUF4129 domain-containing protein [Pirellulales bacterium]